MADKTLTDLADQFYEKERPVGVVLSEANVLAQALAAARFYAGFGPIKSLVPEPEEESVPASDPNAFLYPIAFGGGYLPGYQLSPQIVAGSPVAPVDWVEEDTVIAQSEWAVIRPLFVLYVERENAIHLEASRSLGVDVYGRSSSEIRQDIMQTELGLPALAFAQPILSV